MATKPLLDFDALLAPIAGDNPAGASLRYAGDYDEIKALLPKPDRDAFEASGQEGQWPKLVQVTSQKLREKSKDLAIAAWLTEGLVHQHGFAGLRDGLLLVEGLLERFWDGVYPLADDGDLEVRAAPLQALLERNASLWVGEIPLSRSPIRSPDSDELVPATYNLWHAIVVAQLEDKKPLAGAMESAMADSPTDFLLALYEDVAAAEEAVQSLKRVLADRFGDAAPGTTAIVDALAKCKSRVRTALAQRGADPEQAQSADANGHATEEGLIGPGGAQRAAANGATAGPIRSRDDALARLREVADFFRRTEPHSPIPYLIQRAIHWSRMSFEELLGELVKDENSRHEISTTLGIRAGSSEPAYGNGQEESS